MSPTFYSMMGIQWSRISLGLGQEFSCLLFPLIHILLEDLIRFTFCIPKFQELVRRALLPFHKSFNYFLLLSLPFFFIQSPFFLSSPNSLRLPSTLKPFLKMGKFAYLVDSLKGIERFKAQYRISPGVSIRYCKQGD